jgi:hypothetical protein
MTLTQKLSAMSSRDFRHAYSVGDYWNVCEEAADRIAQLEAEVATLAASYLRMERERDELRADLAALRGVDPIAHSETAYRSAREMPDGGYVYADTQAKADAKVSAAETAAKPHIHNFKQVNRPSAHAPGYFAEQACECGVELCFPPKGIKR